MASSLGYRCTDATRLFSSTTKCLSASRRASRLTGSGPLSLRRLAVASHASCADRVLRHYFFSLDRLLWLIRRRLGCSRWTVPTPDEVSMLRNCRFVFVGLIVLSGCVEVVSPVIIGTKVTSVEPADWEGTWLGPDGVEVTLEVIDSKGGTVALSWSEGTDNESTRIRSMGYFRGMSGFQFVSVEKWPAEPVVTGYVWGRVEKKGDDLIIVPPAPWLFRRFVEEGTLQGETTPRGVVLRDVHTTDIDLLLMKWRRFFFDEENVLVFRRLED